MFRSLLSPLVTLVAIGSLACADVPTPTAPDADDAALNALAARTEALSAEIGRTGMTPALEVKVAALAADINAWRIRTGRNDVVAETTIPMSHAAAVAPRGGGLCVVTCPAVYRSGTRICFLESASCEDGLEICVYTCITFRSTFGLKVVRPKAAPTAAA